MKPSAATVLAATAALALGAGVLVVRADQDRPGDEPRPEAPLATPFQVPKPSTSAPALRTHAKGPALLPDLRIKALDECGAGDLRRAVAHQGRDCFWIQHQKGRRILKFASVTVNLGRGPLDIRSTRSEVPDPPQTSWTPLLTVQRIYHDANGDGIYEPDNFTETRSRAQFYWEHLPSGEDNHGHTHWHVLDFDRYAVVGRPATMVKRGFCFEDNTTYDPWYDDRARHPEVPHTTPEKNVFGDLSDPGVYVGADFGGPACGYRHPDATTIVHGLSVGWADTYPSSLPDQGIDISSLPGRGTFTVTVVADAQHLVDEEVEDNNSASARVTIDGDRVTRVSASGGL
jgi:hypothetical protein